MIMTMTISDIQNRRISAFMDSALPVLKRRFRPNCCVAAARIGLEVFRRLHVAEVRPLPVAVDILNPALVALARAAGSVPADAAGWADWQARGAHWLTIGAGDAPQTAAPGWDGHLVLLLYGSLAIDLTLGQGTRPARGIRLTAVTFQVSPAFVAGEEPRTFDLNGSEVRYTSRLANRGYERAPDWYDRDRCLPAVREILARMRDALGRP